MSGSLDGKRDGTRVDGSRQVIQSRQQQRRESNGEQKMEKSQCGTCNVLGAEGEGKRGKAR